MTKSAAEHYDSHLGPVYSWMVGDIEAALARSDLELQALDLPLTPGCTVVDLGAGFGLHALPLARRGFPVLAIDCCESLLDELRRLAGPLPIRCVRADLLQFRGYLATRADVILCMGDTLTHLPDHAAVETLFAEVAASLADGGQFVTSFRDYATASLQGDQRFIRVRTDEQRMLTCFLEYADTSVTVHDLLHERTDGQWQLRVSSYPKLRLSPAWVMDALRSHGLSVRSAPAAGGMICVVAAAAAKCGAI